MFRFRVLNILLVISFLFFLSTGSYASGSVNSNSPVLRTDSVPEIQLLYNGRAWRNLYLSVKEDQFLFANEFLPGTISMNGKQFRNVDLRYDIYKDELLIPLNRGVIIQLNKEMVDSFSLVFQNRSYLFKNFRNDSLKLIKGYLNVLYSGKSSLMVKYRKEIELLAVDKKYDLFFQQHRIYLVKDGVAYLLSGRRDFLKLLDDQKLQVRSFIKKYRYRISKNYPDSFVPVIKYYDSLKK